MTTQWIVVIGSGVWAKCYGIFDSHDRAVEWVRANQFDVDDAHIFPLNVATLPTLTKG